MRSLNRAVPRDLETIVHKCLEKDPAHRYPSAEVLAERLQRFLDGEPIPERPRSWLNRLARQIWKRPMLSSFVALTLLAVVTGWLVAQHLDPERPRTELQSTLAAGREYIFRGDEPLPGPFRQVYGAPAPMVRSDEEPNCFSLTTHQVVLLELTPDPLGEAYELSAEVRHDSCPVASEVGLYFLFRSEEEPTKPRRGGFYTLTFAERGALAHRNPDGTACCKVAVKTRFFEDGPTRKLPFGVIATSCLDKVTPLTGPGDWRMLKVTVTPDGVAGFWEPGPGKMELVRSFSSARLSQTLHNLAISIQEFTDISTDYRPGSGMGLYVASGKASFRNVTVRPLKGSN